MQNRQFVERVQGCPRREQLQDFNAIQRPTMAFGGDGQFGVGLGQRDIHRPFVPTHAVDQELKRQGRLAGSRTAFVQIQAIPVQTAAEYIVQAGISGGNPAVYWGLACFIIVNFDHMQSVPISTGQTIKLNIILIIVNDPCF